MTDLLDISADDAVLEIGNGLGYQAAILYSGPGGMASRLSKLGQQAATTPSEGCTNVELKIANGYHGWSEHAPFDRVIVIYLDLIPRC